MIGPAIIFAEEIQSWHVDQVQRYGTIEASRGAFLPC
jgi:hypothetical protein